MYTRKYGEGDEALHIPSGYDGVALRQDSLPPPESEGGEGAAEAKPCAAEASARPSDKSGESVLAGLPFLGRLKDSLGLGRFIKFDIGFEEILIAALALYLFFSKDGDKECAVMLAILLFIT